MLTNKAYMNPDGTINWNKRAAFMREAQKRAQKRKIDRLLANRATPVKRAAPKPRTKVANIKASKTELDRLWASAVKTRDNHKCLLCGQTKNVHAHHWYFTKAQGNSTRWEIDNGASLCYACHLYKVHQGAAMYIDKLKSIMHAKIGDAGIERLTMLHATATKFDLELLNAKRAELNAEIAKGESHE